MRRHERLLQTLLRGQSDANIRWADLRALLFYLGLSERVRGSHHLFDKDGVVESSTRKAEADMLSPIRRGRFGS